MVRLVIRWFAKFEHADAFDLHLNKVAELCIDRVRCHFFPLPQRFLSSAYLDSAQPISHFVIELRRGNIAGVGILGTKSRIRE